MDESRRKALVEDLALMLLYLTSWDEKAAGITVRRSWKSYDWDAIDALVSEGLISTSRRSKSAYLTDEACRRADFLVNAFAEFEDGMIASLHAAIDERKKHGGAFRLRIELDLDGIHPCWRELIVPGWFTFADLHQAIQASFLWWDYHLYDFKLHSHGEDLMLVNPDAYGVDAMFAPPAGKYRVVDDISLYLDEVFPRTRTVQYTYDYGDCWVHKIKLIESMKDYDASEPVCTDGEGDAPPEDVGSIPGFEHFLEAIHDEKHPDHADMTEWGHAQCFEPFSVEAANRRIARWGTGETLDEWERRHGGASGKM